MVLLYNYSCHGEMVRILISMTKMDTKHRKELPENEIWKIDKQDKRGKKEKSK